MDYTLNRENLTLASFKQSSTVNSNFETYLTFLYGVTLNLSHQDASFEYPYDYIWSDNFFDQKSGKIGRNSKILSKLS